MLIGIPDYDNYVTHMQTNHPDQLNMKNFFRERQQAATAGQQGGGDVRYVNGGNNGTDCVTLLTGFLGAGKPPSCAIS